MDEETPLTEDAEADEHQGLSAPPPEVRTLVGRLARLRPLTAQDVPGLHRLSLEPEMMVRWRNRGRSLSLGDFQSQLEREALVQFVVSPLSGNEIGGHVYGYGADLNDGYCFAAAMVSHSVLPPGAGAEAFFLLCDHLFAHFDFRKIYIEVIEFNLPQYATVARQLLRIEGRLGQHHYYDGQYWDMVLGAIYRVEFVEWYKRWRS